MTSASNDQALQPVLCVDNAYLLGDQLRLFQLDNPRLFRELFWLGHELIYQRTAKAFVDCGILRSENGRMRSMYQIWCQDGTVIMTDRPEYPYTDRVFPLFTDENIALARIGLWRGYHRVADVGTGSGFLAIGAAREGCFVYASDINPRALRLAQINIAMNGVEDAISLLRDDTLRGAAGKCFDLILSNPPFALTPEGHTFHVAGNGGRHGTSMIDKLLSSMDLLSEAGILAFTALNLVGRSSSHLDDLIRPLTEEGFISKRLRIYPDAVSLDAYRRSFKDTPQSNEWMDELQSRGYVGVEYVLTMLGKGLLPDVNLPRIQLTRYSGDWRRRLARYALWSNVRGENV
jgi:SAM-dependent methyltransferase